MAPKTQETAAYFPFFVKDGKTLYVLQRKYGLSGVGFFVQVLRWLAQVPHHYYAYSDDVDKDRFNDFVGMSESDVRTYVADMVRTGKVDRYLWEEHSVLFIQDFTDNLDGLYSRRKIKPLTRDQIITQLESGGPSDGNQSDDVNIMSTYCDETDAICGTEEREETYKTQVDERDNRLSRFSRLFEEVTGKIIPPGQYAQARLLAERFDNATLEYELARCANKTNPVQYIATYMLTEDYRSPTGSGAYRVPEKPFSDADYSDPALRELAARDSDTPSGGEVPDEQ